MARPGLTTIWRSGRILATGGAYASGLEPAQPAAAVGGPSKSSVIIINSGGRRLGSSGGVVGKPGLLAALSLPKNVPSLYYRGYPDIALLENTAVYTYSGIENGHLQQGLEVYFFPEPVSTQGEAEKMAMKAIAPLLWLQTGAPEPRWTFRNTESGTLEAAVDLGAGVASGETPQVEWSEDLKVRQLLPDARHRPEIP